MQRKKPERDRERSSVSRCVRVVGERVSVCVCEREREREREKVFGRKFPIY